MHSRQWFSTLKYILFSYLQHTFAQPLTTDNSRRQNRPSRHQARECVPCQRSVPQNRRFGHQSKNRKGRAGSHAHWHATLLGARGLPGRRVQLLRRHLEFGFVWIVRLWACFHIQSRNHASRARQAQSAHYCPPSTNGELPMHASGDVVGRSSAPILK